MKRRTMRRWILPVILAAAALALPDAIGSASPGELHEFVRGSWKAIRHAHAGRPVVVHFWGVTCGPCQVEMPRWDKLLHERADLELVTVNADLVPDDPGAVSNMLAETGLAGAENWMFNDGFVERLRFEIDPQWQGEIPLTVLIGRDGGTTTIEGVVEPDVIRTWLDGQVQASK